MTYKLDVLTLTRCKYDVISGEGNQKYFTIPASPTTGILYITQNSPEFIPHFTHNDGKNVNVGLHGLAGGTDDDPHIKMLLGLISKNRFSIWFVARDYSSERHLDKFRRKPYFYQTY
ncbi:MAG: hypothetical protein WA667_01500 [Candidatus Nitrosopolaris sp.]